jgi:galactokinase/mevalonate kinase-like predicted kinase
MHHSRKPHPAMFVQNAITVNPLTAENTNVWIENSYIGAHWTLSHDHIITGVPENDFHVSLAPGQCVDVVPIGDHSWVVRCYHIDEKFAGSAQQEKRFPVVDSVEEIGKCIIQSPPPSGGVGEGGGSYLSAEDISSQANMYRLVAQRRAFRQENWPLLAKNWQHSVFYQVDLEDAAREYREMNIPLPEPLPENAPLMTRIHDAMFRDDSTKAFSLLRQGLTEQVLSEQPSPRMSVYSDQIVWGRSPVRVDIAGGWTDTPPYCLMEGGNVVNFALELNGQPPLQAYVRPCKEPHIILRSIDLGAMEVVNTYEELLDYQKVGSPFSIPKAALVLAGFRPSSYDLRSSSLKAQLEAFGCGIELTLLSAIPAGSGLGTSSVLAATVLGTLNDFCGLAWDKNEIGYRTLVLEQLLTTGGGWQDQFGGILQGVKLLQTERGFEQNPTVRWLPNDLFTQPEYRQCHLLYYTGITRTAKKILAEIVRRMFLNQRDELRLLREMKQHAMDMYEAIQRADFQQMGMLVRKTWQQNQLIDSGTNPPEVEAITRQIDDLCLGYKLGGAGGGGYLYMVAKDPEAAARIKQTLLQNRPNANARFVEMTLSTKGLQVSRS